MANLEDKVCPNHPDRQATGRCTACFKPVCDECTVAAGGEVFCSETCAANHAQSDANLKEMAAREAAAKRKRMIRRLILLLLLIALVLGFGWYFRNNPDKANELRDRASGIAGEVDQAIDDQQGAAE